MAIFNSYVKLPEGISIIVRYVSMCLDSADLQAAPFDAKSHRFEAAGMVQGDPVRLVKLPVSNMSFFMCTCVLPKQVDKGKIRVKSVVNRYKSPPVHPRISGRRSFRLRGSLFWGSTWTRVGRRHGLGLPENQEWNGDWIETCLYISS